ncbi:hypothetical protein T09_769 [Trichinella sp. T9]|nr:hypothetical protein T09_769 [Trichinella sp. T9]
MIKNAAQLLKVSSNWSTKIERSEVEGVFGGEIATRIIRCPNLPGIMIKVVQLIDSEWCANANHTN